MNDNIPSTPAETQVSALLSAMKATVSHVESVETQLARSEFRNAQLETVLKILARRNDGRLAWTEQELADANADVRCILLGALDMDLYGTGSPVAELPADPSPFTREYLGRPCEPSEEEIRLRDLAGEYHRTCEEYDRKVCTGPVVNGEVMPGNAKEMAAINRHAEEVRQRLFRKAQELGFNLKQWQEAIGRPASCRCKRATPDNQDTGDAGLAGFLRRDEYPGYYAGIADNGGVLWISEPRHAVTVRYESIQEAVSTILRSPWLRSAKGLRWEILLPPTSPSHDD